MMPRVRARFHLYLVSLSCIFASTLCLLYELMNRIRAIQTKVFQRKRLDWFCFCALFLALSLSLSLSLRCCPRWSHSRFYSYSHSLSLISLIASLDLWSAARSFFLSLSLALCVLSVSLAGSVSVLIIAFDQPFGLQLFCPPPAHCLTPHLLPLSLSLGCRSGAHRPTPTGKPVAYFLSSVPLHVLFVSCVSPTLLGHCFSAHTDVSEWVCAVVVVFLRTTAS